MGLPHPTSPFRLRPARRCCVVIVRLGIMAGPPSRTPRELRLYTALPAAASIRQRPPAPPVRRDHSQRGTISPVPVRRIATETCMKDRPNLKISDDADARRQGIVEPVDEERERSTTPERAERERPGGRRHAAAAAGPPAIKKTLITRACPVPGAAARRRVSPKDDGVRARTTSTTSLSRDVRAGRCWACRCVVARLSLCVAPHLAHVHALTSQRRCMIRVERFRHRRELPSRERRLRCTGLQHREHALSPHVCSEHAQYDESTRQQLRRPAAPRAPPGCLRAVCRAATAAPADERTRRASSGEGG